MRLKHPHPGKTAAQRRVLDAIGCGNCSPIMAESTRKAMIDAGLIHSVGRQTIGQGWSAASVEHYDMPISVHMAWCAHGSEQCELHPEIEAEIDAQAAGIPVRRVG